MTSKYYSDNLPNILYRNEREEKALQILNVLKQFLNRNLQNQVVLDIGCSGGIITNFLAPYFKKIVGVDVDQAAIHYAKENFQRSRLEFQVMSGERLVFKDETFDIVICNQVYNFVDSPQILMAEIYRVLKKEGVCFFAARNKFAIMEPQYNLPFLSWLPERLAKKYLAFFRKGIKFFGKNYMSYFELKELVSQFKIYSYTLKILKEPSRFGFYKYEKYSPVAKIIPKFLESLLPNFIWILVKK